MDENKIKELREDVIELQHLLEGAKRRKVQELLSLEIRKLETEISQNIDAFRGKEVLSGSHDLSANPPISHGKVHHARIVKEVTRYGWDQSDKFMKIYVDLDGVQSLAAEQVTSEFTQCSFKLKVTDLKGVDYLLHVGHLHEEIVAKDSYHKVKTNKVLIMMKKNKEATTWPYVVKKNVSKEKEKQPPVDDSTDPNESLMKMMKKMYEEGDDEMKRTIAKSWQEAQEKQSMGGMGGMGAM